MSFFIKHIMFVCNNFDHGIKVHQPVNLPMLYQNWKISTVVGRHSTSKSSTICTESIHDFDLDHHRILTLTTIAFWPWPPSHLDPDHHHILQHFMPRVVFYIVQCAFPFQHHTNVAFYGKMRKILYDLYIQYPLICSLGLPRFWTSQNQCFILGCSIFVYSTL